MSVLSWDRVADDDPTLKLHWVKVYCLLRSQIQANMTRLRRWPSIKPAMSQHPVQGPMLHAALLAGETRELKAGLTRHLDDRYATI